MKRMLPLVGLGERIAQHGHGDAVDQGVGRG